MFNDQKGLLQQQLRLSRAEYHFRIKNLEILAHKLEDAREDAFFFGKISIFLG